VLGYHGCARATADLAITGKASILESTKPYNWLGPGAYFWENDPHRALEFARWKASRDKNFVEPTVIGAVIDLGNCLDLVTQESLQMLKKAHASFVSTSGLEGLALPKNQNSRDGNEDRVLRYLDCAVITHLHELVLESNEPAYDTVRGMFTEGGDLYAGAGFREKTHVQIAVRNQSRITGVFIPRPMPV